MDTKFGGRILYEFEIAPANVETLGVVFDITRQSQGCTYSIVSGSGQVTPVQGQQRTFPWLQSPPKDNENPNDDAHSKDEDNTPTNRHIYSWDAPGRSIQAGQSAFCIVRWTFKEWARIKLEKAAFKNEQNKTEGSRASDKEDWHLAFYLKSDMSAKWVEDNTSPSANAPGLLSFTGAEGTCAVTVNEDNADTEGWIVKYVKIGDKWKVDGDKGSDGWLTKQGGTWQGDGKKDGNTRVTLTVTHTGGDPFGNEDFFSFSTFKSTATGGKKNETKEGEFPVTDGP